MTTGGRGLGPAIIVASVVLGPGSILAASRLGCDWGYQLLWLIAIVVVLLIGMTALAARIGTCLPGTPCEELAQRGGRGLAVFVGVVLFLVIACFQFSNNVAVVLALEPYTGGGAGWASGLLLVLNLLVLAALFGARHLYRPVEIGMKVLVGVMVLGFLGNLVFAKVDLLALLAGFVPRVPEGLEVGLPRRVDDKFVDPMLFVQAMVGTTFSVAGAFYQAYLVRDKGWTRDDLQRGLIDSVVGIAVLGFLTMTIMVTAAAVLHGTVRGDELKHAADVARQLEPAFGAGARVLFSFGLLAGALSSFLVNAMIGGAVLSDGLGFGGAMDQRGPKVCTAIALLVGMGVAMAMQATGWSALQLVYFAQAMTVIGNPVLAGALLWLSRDAGAPRWMQVVGVFGFLLVFVLAVRTGVSLYLKVT